MLTVAGEAADVEAAARRLATEAVGRLRLTGHRGAHPRLGVLDVVPFVTLGTAPGQWAVDARDAFCAWAGSQLALPCFRYGPLPAGHERTLPEVRRAAFSSLSPDAGPPRPHPSAGAAAVGARGVLVAYNLWLAPRAEDGSGTARGAQDDPGDHTAGGNGAGQTTAGNKIAGDHTASDKSAGAGASDEGPDLGRVARALARSLRGPTVRALAFELTGGVQVSCNLVDPATVGPAEVYDAVADQLAGTTTAIARCELVGLVPRSVLDRIPASRWPSLDLAPERTIEARLEAAGLTR